MHLTLTITVPRAALASVLPAVTVDSAGSPGVALNGSGAAAMTPTPGKAVS